MQVDGYSLDAQRERLLKEAKHREMKVVGEFSDEGKSGKNVVGRPEFQRMLKLIEQKADDIDYVLVFKLSRFGRNTADVLNSLQFMQDYGVNLLCVDDGIDSAGASGKLMIPVLSAVAEIERENIQAQTMAGRWQKAKEGKWNGGFAPYGYKLINGMLEIEETEAEVIQIIYDKYVHTSMGMNGIARWLNNNGYKKIKRQNNTVDLFSAHFVKGVIDNPVYVGKIAYGRRKNEKIDGRRNEYHVVKQDDYEIFDGQHEAIVSEELWLAANMKRQATSIKHEKVYSLEHEHILSGILKCPVCGSSMYGNINRKKKMDGTHYKDGFYYVCKHRKLVDGQACTYKRQPPQDQINAEVEAIVLEAIDNPIFVDSMKDKLNQKTDEDMIRERIEALEKSRSQVAGAKSKLFEQMDRLDITDEFYDDKYADMQARVDKLYREIAELDREINKAEQDLQVVFEGKATIETAYQVLQVVKEKYDKLADTEKKKLMNELLERVEIFEERQKDGRLVKSVHFKFSVIYKGQETDKVWWDEEKHVETVCLLSKLNVEHHIEVELQMDELDLTAAESKATYEEIKDYVLEHTGLKVSSLYIAQVKEKCGIIERVNYNLPKSENSRQPKCPPEKEVAIREALEYFRMI